jgi:hypothetical protein
MVDIKDRAREYLRLQTQLNGGGLFHCNILNLMLGFAEQKQKNLKKDKQYFSDSLDKQIEATLKLDKENAELSEKLNRHKHDCPNCSAFGKHCPHRVNGDPYTYDCYLTVADLEKENAELKKEWQEQVQKATDEGYARTLQTIQLSKAKEHIRTLISCLIDCVQEGDKDYCHIADAKQFLNSEVENETKRKIF